MRIISLDSWLMRNPFGGKARCRGISKWVKDIFLIGILEKVTRPPLGLIKLCSWTK